MITKLEKVIKEIDFQISYFKQQNLINPYILGFLAGLEWIKELLYYENKQEP